MAKNPRQIPAITNQQMEWVITESGLPLAEFQKMIKEMCANPFHFESVELAQGVIGAARDGLPKPGPIGEAFVEMVVSWEPWLWEENKE